MSSRKGPPMKRAVTVEELVEKWEKRAENCEAFHIEKTLRSCARELAKALREAKK